MKIIRSVSADIPRILELLQSAKKENISAEERKKTGFIQGKIDENVLATMQHDLGVFIAKHDTEIIGVACSSSFGLFPSGPIVMAGQYALNHTPVLHPEDIFQYGPVVVHADWRKKGILRQLLSYTCRQHSQRFQKGLAFVEEENALSLSIHRHYFHEDIGSFTFGGAKYYVFLFNPKDFF